MLQNAGQSHTVLLIIIHKKIESSGFFWRTKGEVEPQIKYLSTFG